MRRLRGKGTLTEAQKGILGSFVRFPDSQLFYLTGGTALAEFYLGHRRSYDLDLFTTEKDLVLPFSRIMEESLKTDFSVQVVRRFQTFVEFEMGKAQQRVRVHLAYDSPFRFEEPVNSELGIKVNDYRDLVVDKLLAFFGRVEPRDAVDLFFILEGEDLWELAALASQKDPGFDLYWLAVALEKTRDFPNEIQRWPVDMLLQVDAGNIKGRFSTLARRLMDRIQKGD